MELKKGKNMDNKMPDQLQGSLQENALTLLCFSERHHRLVRDTVPPELFSTFLYRDLVARVHAYIDQWKKPPGRHLPDLFEDVIAEKTDKAKSLRMLLRSMKDLSENLNEDYAVSKLYEFTRQQRLKLGVVEAIESIEQGNLDRAEKKLADILAAKPPKDKDVPDELVTRPLSDIPLTRVKWLVPNKIPLGKLSMLIGHPGTLKTHVLLDWAARISKGTPFADGAPCKQGSTFVLSAEDDPDDTLGPRAEAAGADRRHIYIVDAVRKSNGAEQFFSLVSDLAPLERKIEKIGDVRLLVIDAINSYIGTGVDSYSDAAVRALLAPLVALAARQKLAVVAVMHMNKAAGTGGDVMLRAMGSVAFVAVARAAWLVVRDPEDPERRLFLPAKNNLAADSAGMAFRPEVVRVKETATGRKFEMSRLVWEDTEVLTTANEALSAWESNNAETRSVVREAEEFLRELLANGPVSTEEMEEAAKAKGHATSAIKRARMNLKTAAHKVGKIWMLELPAEKTAKNHPSHSWGKN